MIYHHALWGPSPAWTYGYVWSAPVSLFKAEFAAKVRELGLPLLVWESDPEKTLHDAS